MLPHMPEPIFCYSVYSVIFISVYSGNRIQNMSVYSGITEYRIYLYILVTWAAEAGCAWARRLANTTCVGEHCR